MKSKSAILFWIETGLAVISSLLFVMTVLWRNWIELVFKLDLDAGNGAVEWWAVIVTGGTAIVLILVTAGTWRRLQHAKRNARVGIPTGN